MSGDDEIAASEFMMVEGEKEPVKDRYFLTYVLFYAFGTLTQVPNNFFTTATEYWMYKFRDPAQLNYSSENRTGMQAEFVSTFSIVSNVTNVLFFAATVYLISKVSITRRLIGSLCFTISMFAVTIIFVELNTDSWQKGFFVVTLLIGCALTASSSVFLITLFELVSKFPPEYLAAILSGQSICGIFASLTQIFSLSIGARAQINGLVYFLIGMFFVFLALVCLLITLNKSHFFKFNLEREAVKRERPKLTKARFLGILDGLKYYLISMVLVLGCSIMMHPGIMALVVSIDKNNGKKWNDVFFVPVTSFLLYNVFDFIGREISGKLQKPNNGIVITVLSLFRVALVPMIMLCNIHPRSHLPVIFDKDFAYILFVIIFAFSNGFLVNLCVIQIPKVTKPDDKILSMLILVIVMFASMSICSFGGAALVKAL